MAQCNDSIRYLDAGFYISDSKLNIPRGSNIWYSGFIARVLDSSTLVPDFITYDSNSIARVLDPTILDSESIVRDFGLHCLVFNCLGFCTPLDEFRIPT